jgi:hypothetical protein
MSRWIDEFKSHAFQAIWIDLKSTLDGVAVDDKTVITSVTELARLKKVVVYLDELIQGVDPEIVPAGTWTSFGSQATPCNQQIQAFVTNRNIAHIQAANKHADNLLTYIRPYMVSEKKL